MKTIIHFFDEDTHERLMNNIHLALVYIFALCINEINETSYSRLDKRLK